MNSRAVPLGVLLGTQHGLYQLLPGEPLRCVLPDLEVSALTVGQGMVLAVVPDQGIWQHDGGLPTEWRQVWEGEPRSVRISQDGTRYIGTTKPTSLLHASATENVWEPSQTLESVVRYQRTRSNSSDVSRWALQAIAFPSGSLLVAVDGAGIWLSNDEGRSWMPRSEGIDPAITSLWEHPERSDRIYATTASGLFRSEDGGFSWLRSITGLDRAVAHSVAILPGAPDALILSTARRTNGESGALFRSIDGGVRWVRLLLGNADEWPHAPLVAALPASRDTVFAVADRRVWASHDRGGDWRALTDLADSNALTSVQSLAIAL
jgi:hypothetical protein